MTASIRSPRTGISRACIHPSIRLASAGRMGWGCDATKARCGSSVCDKGDETTANERPDPTRRRYDGMSGKPRAACPFEGQTMEVMQVDRSQYSQRDQCALRPNDAKVGIFACANGEEKEPSGDGERKPRGRDRDQDPSERRQVHTGPEAKEP